MIANQSGALSTFAAVTAAAGSTRVTAFASTQSRPIAVPAAAAAVAVAAVAVSAVEQSHAANRRASGRLNPQQAPESNLPSEPCDRWRVSELRDLDSLSQPEAYVIADIQGFCAAMSPVEAQLRMFVEEFSQQHAVASSPGSACRERVNILLARELRSTGYTVAIRQHRGHGPALPGPYSAPTDVRDSYIVFSGVPGNPNEDYVLELDFRERFNIASPTPFYNTCLSVVPRVWVGPLEQLLPLVRLLCDEMSLAFNERALDMPPWRDHDKIASRWISAELLSFSVDSAGGMCESPDSIGPARSHVELMRSLSTKSLDDVLSEAGVTLTPLQLGRTCSLSFDKIEPVSPVRDASSPTKKAVPGLLAMNIVNSPAITQQQGAICVLK